MQALNSDEIRTLLGKLGTAASSDEAAFDILSVALRLAAAAAMAEVGTGPIALVLRATMHVRSEQAYRRLWVAEQGGSSLTPVDGLTPHYLPSATAWQAILARRVPLALNVPEGTITSVGTSEPWSIPFTAGSESVQRFMGRHASHVLVVPLRGVRHGIEGVLNVEIESLLTGLESPAWPACVRDLQLLADLGTPSLLSLPDAQRSDADVDELLPVAGREMSALLPLLRTFARQDETVLITGPTGSGKSRLARWCHEHSSRGGKAFECLDLLSIPEELQAAELFGWKRGAFTGALRDSPGAIARARGGTFFLDEIDKLSLRSQAALLRLLDEKRYRPLGDSGAELHADVRFIIGTNVDLASRVRAGAFREDLYFRVNVLPVKLSSLNARRDEIAAWASYMLIRRNQEESVRSVALEQEAASTLENADWPGNLRQLDNIVRRAYALALAQSESGQTVNVTRDCVRRALSYDDPSAFAAGESLMVAATNFVREAKRHGSLDLDLLDAIRGYVLAVAIEQLGLEEGLRSVGKDALLKSRNHHKMLRKERDRVASFHEVVGGAIPELFDAAPWQGER